jgi:hypothetical protein
MGYASSLLYQHLSIEAPRPTCDCISNGTSAFSIIRSHFTAVFFHLLGQKLNFFAREIGRLMVLKLESAIS